MKSEGPGVPDTSTHLAKCVISRVISCAIAVRFTQHKHILSCSYAALFCYETCAGPLEDPVQEVPNTLFLFLLGVAVISRQFPCVIASRFHITSTHSQLGVTFSFVLLDVSMQRTVRDMSMCRAGPLDGPTPGSFAPSLGNRVEVWQ